ncbi:LysR family transcriptional regulator [Citrobacter rodentium]|uniref:LysR-family transcriptional regulator n=2 Tax=Citrobacter rodentium TaxID=67825 RepID=D2TII5_CITRI|nr:LysR family transcriptional regulator [Citrobacter rodentium]KIQ51329.1 LysR family transcriptional regulator [Citrobacter rodentium]QBY28138.1 LysR family transcriptional regulator [Citrobacter rodentium]UHO29983.1 LysR family transcriptional regulator [Citrobacter rodentium NBRC 105723 = DSM 16636]CBG88312.1 putative LysR-family transcriptional regulator [Citrobacter rodentium ICC168]HAT8011515.1 LysR family transcriptional regulator [Citrobacter rodentium NBRC 105723 = DSM 16636]
MRMSIKQLRAFLAVAHTLNFAHASERLNISQPALSLTIKGLEESLGGPLLLRTTRKVTLTQEGETLLTMARQLIADWDNTEEAMRQRFTLQRGKVSVAAMPSFAANVLPPALKTFRDRYAGINVTVHDVINEQVIEMVSEGRVEMGIAFEPDYSGHLHFTPLGLDRFVAIVPPGSRFAERERISWRELLSLDFIALQRPSAVRLMLEEQLAQSGRPLKVALESHQLVTIGRLVANGLGGSAVPALCHRQMTELGAVCLALDGPVIERRVGVLRSAHHKLSTAAQALLETLKSAYSA